MDTGVMMSSQGVLVMTLSMVERVMIRSTGERVAILFMVMLGMTRLSLMLLILALMGEAASIPLL
jgi:hypothetical protein